MARNQKGFMSLEAILLIVVVIIATGLIGGFVYLRSSEDHSSYSKLSTDSYSDSRVNFSFKYPSFMEKDAAMEQSYAAAYISTPQKMLFVVTTLSVSPILKALHMSPQQYITDAQEHSTSFVNKLNSISNASPNVYDSLFGGCSENRKLIKTASGQIAMLCIASTQSAGVTQAQVIGATNDYTIKFALNMPTDTWNAHQKVWQKVEKSFNFH